MIVLKERLFAIFATCQIDDRIISSLLIVRGKLVETMIFQLPFVIVHFADQVSFRRGADAKAVLVTMEQMATTWAKRFIGNSRTAKMITKLKIDQAFD